MSTMVRLPAERDHAVADCQEIAEVHESQSGPFRPLP
jgi:hypothetical protein